ncbi:MAG: phosphate ABC transporter substrate-binding protein [Chloroflexota bacterium]
MSLRGWLLAILLICLAGCGTPTLPPDPVRFTVAGSTIMTPLLDELAEAYQTHHPQVSITVERGGSRQGLARATSGEVALGASSWLPESQARDVWSAPVALDGIAVIVHPENPVTDLTLAQLREVFSGRAWLWDEMAGSGEVQVISREDGSGSRASFEALVMEGQPVTPTALVMPNNQAAIDYVATHPAAIGYASMGYLSNTVRAIAVEGVLPSPASVVEGAYHLVRPLFLVAAQEPGGAARSFVDFVLSAKGQQIVSRQFGRVR